MGPPGAGKGTQAGSLASNLGVMRVSSGDLFRQHQERDTGLGRLAQSYMERGELVPDDVTIKMVMEWINSPDQVRGFVLDGFPRTIAQAEILDKKLCGKGGIDRVVYIKVEENELIRRLNGRMICRLCQKPYHQEFSPPADPSSCDRCGGELYQREDDKPESVKKRIQVYREETEPVVQYYRRAGKLREIDGLGPVVEVEQALVRELES